MEKLCTIVNVAISRVRTLFGNDSHDQKYYGKLSSASSFIVQKFLTKLLLYVLRFNPFVE